MLLGAAFLLSTAACVRKSVRQAAAPQAPADNSYMDLARGGGLRILVPILRSGGYRAATESAYSDGNTIVLSASNVTGYEVSHFAVEGRANGKVRLKFRSAEVTKNGTTLQASSAPPLPFSLPLKPQHVRLIYLVRNSPSDHNMAIAASGDLDELNKFTERLKVDPTVCESDGGIFCSWVPAGVAVRPE